MRWIIILLLLLCSCQADAGIDESISVMFCPRKDCGAFLNQMMLDAKESIDCAFFDLDIDEIIDTLKNKSGTINVRIVFEKDNAIYINNNTRTDDVRAYMHHKFCVIDDDIVLTGSFNPTKNARYFNNNNLIMINSSKAVDIYNSEFMHLWSGRHGDFLHEEDIEIYFCPRHCKQKDDRDNIAIRQIKELIESANKSIMFAYFSFTHQGITDALLKKGNDIEINGIMEKLGSNSRYSSYNVLRYQGHDIILDDNPKMMHHKFMVIDEGVVITGSFNPSNNAINNNNENILIIKSEAFSQFFVDEYNFLYQNFTQDSK